MREERNASSIGGRQKEREAILSQLEVEDKRETVLSPYVVEDEGQAVLS